VKENPKCVTDTIQVRDEGGNIGRLPNQHRTHLLIFIFLNRARVGQERRGRLGSIKGYRVRRNQRRGYASAHSRHRASPYDVIPRRTPYGIGRAKQQLCNRGWGGVPSTWEERGTVASSRHEGGCQQARRRKASARGASVGAFRTSEAPWVRRGCGVHGFVSDG